MVGSSIGSFNVVGKLGEGGMGVVYLGEHRLISRKVAIKVLRPHLSNDPVIVERFFTEARATSMIRHPGLVEVSDCDLLPDGSAYIVMELLEGESLRDHLVAQGRIPEPRALVLARHIADALAAAHRQSIVHRDLKPDNVFLLSPAVATKTPIKILDFGIAKLMDGGGAAHMTRTGVLLGTPTYMSPEQCRGAGTVDHRTDIYALGCLLYEMLTGRPPFIHEGMGALIQAHLSETPQRLRALDPTISPAMDDLVTWTLAKSPDQRPQTMSALVEELDALGSADGPAPRNDQRGALALGSTLPTMRSVAPAARPPQVRMTAKIETTLGAAAWERPMVERPRPRGSRVWPVVFVLAIAGVGAGLWQMTRHPAEIADRDTEGARRLAEPAAAAPADVVEPPPRHRVPPPRPVEETPPAEEEPPPPPRPSVHHPVAMPPPSTAPSSAGRGKVTITSQPSGADVCLASNRELIGKTSLSLPVNGDRSRPMRLLIRKRGYRGQEITISPDQELKKAIRLDKLGPDDMEDIENCQRR
jgi:serine/threonine-protein kinase